MPRSETPSNLHGVRITHPERVVFPKLGLTKQELAEYYAWVAPYLLEDAKNRPLTLVRCPEGTKQQCFYQRHPFSGMPDAMPRVTDDQDGEELLYVKSRKDVLTCVQMSVIEFHVWGSHVRDLEHADRLVFDLDPGPGVSREIVVGVAHEFRDMLKGLGFESYPRVTGGKGLHLVVPIAAKSSWEDVKGFCLACTEIMSERSPHVINNPRKDKRRGKIYLDYLRNQRTATAIANFSVRARPGAPVAVPVSWKEVTAELAFDRFNVKNLAKRLTKRYRDPWEGYGEHRPKLP